MKVFFEATNLIAAAASVVLILGLHFGGKFKKNRAWVFSIFCNTAFLLVVFLLFAARVRQTTLLEMAFLVVCYSSFLFVAISDLLQGGFATYLTKKRGEKWVKELEYL